MNRKLFILPAVVGTLLSLSSCGTNPVGNDKLVIGLECAYQPFNWSDTKQNEFNVKVSNKANLYVDGYDVQIAKILGQKLNMEVEFMQIDWLSLIPELEFGTINAVIAGMTDTEERRQTIDFTDEYYRSELVLVVKKSVADSYVEVLNSNDFTSLISGQVVVSQTSTVTDDVINIFKDNHGAIHANPVDSFALAATDVSNGSAFAMTAELPVAQSIVSSFSDLGIIHIEQSILGETQSELGVSIGIQKGNTELQEKLNAALSKITTEQRVQLMTEAVERSAE